MIYITKIIGESFNLETGEEHQALLEISNGISTRLIAVSPNSIPGIVELFAEAGRTAQVTAKGPVTQGMMVAAALADAVEDGIAEDEELDESPFDPEETEWPEDDGPQESLDAYEDEDTGVGSI